MNRRNFILASGTAVLMGTSPSATQRPAVGLEFELSTTPDKNPQSVKSVLVDFNRFKLKPHYLDSSKDLNVQITVSLDGIESQQIQPNISVKRGIDRSDVSSHLPLVIDDIDTSGDSINGEIEIVVNHPDLDSETYRQSFQIADTNVIDSFSDGDISEYVGDNSSVSVQSNTVKDGDYAIKVDSGRNNIRSTSGLPNYPSQGDVFDFHHNFPSDAKPRFYWGVQDNSNYYYGELDDPNSTLRIGKFDGGSETELGSTSITFENNTWVRSEIEWRTNGRTILKHFNSSGTELGSVDVTDTTFTSGGVGWGEFSRIIIEDFEDNDLSNYDTVIQPGNAEPDFNIVSDSTYNGSYALKVDDGGQNQGGHLLDTTERESYPSAGDEWDFWIRIDGGSELAGMFYGVQNDSYNTRYHASFHENQDRIDLLKWKDKNQPVQETSQSFSYNLGEWVRGHIKWQTDGTHKFELFDQNNNSFTSVQMTDSNYTSGGIGWSQSNGSDDYGPIWLDYAKF